MDPDPGQKQEQQPKPATTTAAAAAGRRSLGTGAASGAAAQSPPPHPSASARRSIVQFSTTAASRQRRSMAANHQFSSGTSTKSTGATTTTGAVSASLALQQSMMTSKIDNRPAVVIEIGHRLTRVGFAGEFVPREIFRTEWVDPMDGPPPPRAQPIFDRRRTEREQYELLVKFLKNIVFRILLTTVTSRRIILVESLLTPTWERQALAHALFDCASLSPHSILFAPSHLLCSFPFNARTCLVLDLGADEAVLFPIAEGVLMLNSWETSSSPCATALERTAKRLMMRYGRVVRRRNTIGKEEGETEEEEKAAGEGEKEVEGRPLNELDAELAQSMRLWEDLVVRFCFASTAARGRRLQAHLTNPEANSFEQPAPPMQLQFGAELLLVPGIVREAVAEQMFTQSDEPDSRSVAQLVLDCVAKVSIDLRRQLLKNLLIVGGISRMPGFLARLKTELLNLIADGYRHPQLAQTLTDIQFYQFPSQTAGQLFCPWLGGSMFGTLDDALDRRSLTRRQWQQQRRVPDWTNAIDAHFADFAITNGESKSSPTTTIVNGVGPEQSTPATNQPAGKRMERTI